MSDTDERREHSRVPARLEVRYPGKNAFFADYTQNISKGGFFVKTDDPLEKGSIFHFDIFVPGVDDPFRLKGEVRWAVTSAEIGGLSGKIPSVAAGMGIAFLFDSREERVALHEFVEDLMSDALGDTISAKLMELQLS